MWWNEETLQEALEVLTGVGLRSAAGCGDGWHVGHTLLVLQDC